MSLGPGAWMASAWLQTTASQLAPGPHRARICAALRGSAVLLRRFTDYSGISSTHGACACVFAHAGHARLSGAPGPPGAPETFWMAFHMHIAHHVLPIPCRARSQLAFGPVSPCRSVTRRGPRSATPLSPVSGHARCITYQARVTTSQASPSACIHPQTCVTLAGQIGYVLAPMVAMGEMLGRDQPVILHLLDIERAANPLKGLEMELIDAAFPLLRVRLGNGHHIDNGSMHWRWRWRGGLIDAPCCTQTAPPPPLSFTPSHTPTPLPPTQGVVTTFSLEEACKDVDIAVLVGGFPRGPGMERKDLMAKNAPIFGPQGKALNDFAKPDVRVLVVANPANTNAWIVAQVRGYAVYTSHRKSHTTATDHTAAQPLPTATHHSHPLPPQNAPRIPPSHITALTRLDHNRAVGQVALRAKVPVSDVRNVIIWGNHSSTQYPDVNHASVRGKPAREVLRDDAYLDGPFVSEIQQRGKAVINLRGASSALSAAHSACDHVRDWVLGTPSGAFVSMAVMSKGEYGVPAGIVYSFPVKCKVWNERGCV